MTWLTKSIWLKSDTLLFVLNLFVFLLLILFVRDDVLS